MGGPNKNFLSKLSGFLIFTIVIWGIYIGFSAVIKFVGFNPNSGYFKLFQLIKGGLILIWLLGISYNLIWSKHTVKNRPVLFAIIVALLYTMSAIFVFLIYDNNKIYPYLKTDKRRGFKGHIHEKDSVLGYKPIENSEGIITFKHKDPIPIRYDENGFRISHTRPFNTEFKRPLILFLGCSVTWGNACYAEDTFPYIVGERLNFSYINAGVCGYGLSQMYILATKLIPKYQPDYVVVQYSDWLTQRTVKGFAPSYVLQVPNPYFSENDQSIVVNYPKYLTDMYVMSDWEYDKEKSGMSNYLNFTFRTGFPSLMKNYWHTTLTKRNLSGKILDDDEKVERFVYDGIIDLSNENNSRVIILNFGHFNSKQKPKEEITQYDVPFADSYSLLKQYANNDETTFSKLFHHWAWDGQDSIVIDIHPNPLAHKIIAESIINEIHKTNKLASVKFD